jgi:hypothetical protein
MLTNEQRAHDLALIMVQDALRPDNIPVGSTNKDGIIKKDAFEIYLNAYNIALNAMNRTFQD